MYTRNQLILPSNMEKNTRFFAIAGFSLNGPVGVPFAIKADVDPVDVLGECRLAENVKMARTYGITPLILRLNGSHGECVIVHEASGKEAIRLKSLEANDDTNNIDVHLFPTHLVIQGIRTSHSYYFADYKGITGLVSAIKQNHHFGNGEVDAETIQSVPLEGLCLQERHLDIAGADDGFNFVSNHDETDTPEKLEMQLTLLREGLIEEEGLDINFAGEFGAFQIDTILFTDIAYEKAPVELARIFGNFARSKTYDQMVYCSAVLGSNSFTEERFGEEDEDYYAAEINTLVQAERLHPYAADYLKHVEVVIGSHRPTNPRYTALPGAGPYAFMRYNLPEMHNSASNKELLHLNALRGLQLSQDEVANLSGSGYICIVPSIKKGFVPYSSKNLYPQHPLFSKPHYMRSIHYDVNLIAGFFNQYIGEHVTDPLLQNILSQITTYVNKLKEEHAIYKDIRIEVLNFTESALDLSVSFDLYGEIERVTTGFSYVPSSEVNITW